MGAEGLNYPKVPKDEMGKISDIWLLKDIEHLISDI